jgi:hypothetical protein
VLTYSQFKQTPGRQAEIAAPTGPAAPRETGETPACELPACLDRDDQKFLELARDSGARAPVPRQAGPQAGPPPVIAARFAILTPNACNRCWHRRPDAKNNSLRLMPQAYSNSG